MKKLGSRIGLVTIDVTLNCPLYEEHGKALLDGSLLLLADTIEKQVQKHVHRQVLEQLRKIKMGLTP